MEKIKNMFDKIAPSYDCWNNIISFYTHNRIKQIAIKSLKIKAGSKVLDLCCGSGDLSKIAKNIEPSIESFGADFSQKMIDIAKIKSPDTKLFLENATNTKFENSYFDYVLMGFGLRNIKDRKKALNEVFRILKTGGCFLHIDFGCKNLLSKVYDLVVLLLAKLFSKNAKAYKYLINSKNEFPTPSELVKEFVDCGFRVRTIDFCCFNLISYQILIKD